MTVITKNGGGYGQIVKNGEEMVQDDGRRYAIAALGCFGRVWKMYSLHREGRKIKCGKSYAHNILYIL